MLGNNYRKLQHERITKTLAKIKSLAKIQAFITLKDHENNFKTSYPCRLATLQKAYCQGSVKLL